MSSNPDSDRVDDFIADAIGLFQTMTGEEWE